ncbi:MAG: MFS transporter [Deltaproteobacteria bacterium]|nr:MFS transporter [Deltaproteobacteria bacterium]
MVKRPVFFYGWVIVAIIVVSMVLIYGIRHSFAVFFSRILQEFPWSRGNIAIMFSLNIFIYGFLAPVAGTLADRWKPRRMMPLGVVILGLATAGCAFANKLWHFYFLFGFLMPLGSAFSGWPIMAPSLVNWFTKRKGLVLGLGQMGGGLSFVYSIFVEFTISQMGWRNTFIILAVILVIFLLPLYFFFFYFRPEEKGLHSYGVEPTAPLPPPSAGGGVIRKPMISERTLSEVMRTPQLWLLVLSYALYWGVGCYLILAHQVKFTEDAGYSSLFSVSVFALFGITLFMGQLSGFISDWLGREKTVTLATLLSLGALLALMSVRDTSQPWLLYGYSISLGYGAGLFSPTLFAASADIFHRRHYGVVAGLLLAGMGAGGAVGPWIGGYLFDLSGSYTNSFILSMVSMGLSCISLWLAAPRKTTMS